MIEAWASAYDDGPGSRQWLDTEHRYLRRKERAVHSGRLTALARTVFGPFVPRLDYPSPLDIETELAWEVQAAAYSVAGFSQRILSRAFIDAFAALIESREPVSESPRELLEDVRALLDQLDETSVLEPDEPRTNQVYRELHRLVPVLERQALSDTAARVLAVYKSVLDERVKIQKATFEPIEAYLNVVNQFLEGKHLAVEPVQEGRPRIRARIRFRDGTEGPLRALSSGERQIVTLLYVASKLAEESAVVLIDEPEISLHVDWQRMLLQKLGTVLGQRQVIVCTHSPEIGADCSEWYQEIRPVAPRRRGPRPDETSGGEIESCLTEGDV